MIGRLLCWLGKHKWSGIYKVRKPNKTEKRQMKNGCLVTTCYQMLWNNWIVESHVYCSRCGRRRGA